MTRDKSRSLWQCRHCGAQAPQYQGFCHVCKIREPLLKEATHSVAGQYSWLSSTSVLPEELSNVSLDETPRISLPLKELNQVLGGGIVQGSLILIGGDPGVGKSTLLLQVSNLLAETYGSVVYVSGEESVQQIKLRAERLGISGRGIHVLAETDMLVILDHIQRLSPTMVVIDSIQSVYLPDENGAPGTIGQVRECGTALLRWAKTVGTPVMITGHMTKDGSLAGPRVLEHMVDVVLYLEESNLGSYRLIRGEKNRFGSTNEVGVFEMKDNGLEEVQNPSEIALASRMSNAVGSAIVPVIEGTRPLLVEVQALTTPSSLPTPRRVANGVDMSRMMMVIAVLFKRAGLSFANQDVIINVAGGFRATEPASDLALALSMISSLYNTPIADGGVALGEIGLGGEMRGVSQMPRRLSELNKMGFASCVVPNNDIQLWSVHSNVKVNATQTLMEAIKVAFPEVPNIVKYGGNKDE